MGKAADDTAWLDELASTRDQEKDDFTTDHPVDIEAEFNEQPADEVEIQPGKPEPKDDQKVPLATLLDERNKLTARIQSLENELNNTKLTAERADRIEKQLLELRDQRQEQPAIEPDYLDDPKAYVDHRTQSVVKQLQDLGDQLKEATKAQDDTKQRLVQQQQLQAIVQGASAAEQAYMGKAPDYYEALEHVRNINRTQLKLAYPQATDVQINQALNQQELMTAGQLLAQGRNPAEYVYEYAKAVGYKAKQQQAAQPAHQPDMREKRERAQSLGGAGTPPGTDIDQLMGMEKDEFDQAMVEMFGRRR